MAMLKGGVEGEASAEDKKNRYRLVILSFLCLVAVILGGIVIANALKNKPSDDETTELIYDDTENKKIVAMLDSYSELYGEGKHDEALAEYQKKMDEAIENKDYDMYLRLFSSRDMMLIGYENCEDIMKSYDNLRVDELPANVRVNVLSTAAVTSGECGNSEKQVYYENEVQQLFDKGEVERDESI